ncbi:hypothetical protein BLNAU_20752 [Blattamonas nauphoetae]|uniref:Uncharacterized protein n=1 Tax=Blattamonas nauphoetae TaxID=2049346 RepID=A0ABQ9X004_9EUKA|nr:hypothetical protein BLNAU_20752 [Blattamonas nauphoetae]
MIYPAVAQFGVRPSESGVQLFFHDSYLSLHSVSESLLFKSSLSFVADSALPYPQAAFGMQWICLHMSSK